MFLLERCLPCDGADSEILMSKTDWLIWQSDSLIMVLGTQLPSHKHFSLSLPFSSLSLSFLSLSLSLSFLSSLSLSFLSSLSLSLSSPLSLSLSLSHFLLFHDEICKKYSCRFSMFQAKVVQEKRRRRRSSCATLQPLQICHREQKYRGI